MEFLYYIMFGSLLAASYHALPLPEEKNSKPEELIVFHPVYLIENRELLPLTPERRIQKRQADYLPSGLEDSDNDISLSETRRYYPYFRIRRIYTSHNGQPKYPASNYADSYDRFPTVA